MYACIVACLSMNKTLKDPMFFRFVDSSRQPLARISALPVSITITCIVQTFPQRGAMVYGVFSCLAGIVWVMASVSLYIGYRMHVAVIVNFIAMEVFSSTAPYNFWFLYNLSLPSAYECHRMNTVGQLIALLTYGIVFLVPEAPLELLMTGIMAIASGCIMFKIPVKSSTHEEVNIDDEDDVDAKVSDTPDTASSRRVEIVTLVVLCISSIVQNAFKASIDYTIKTRAQQVTSSTEAFVEMLEMSGFLTVLLGVLLSVLPVMAGIPLCGLSVAPVVFLWVSTSLQACTTVNCLVAIMCALKAGDTCIIPPVREIIYTRIDLYLRKRLKLYSDTYAAWIGKMIGIIITIYQLNGTAMHTALAMAFLFAFYVLWLSSRYLLQS